jgi:hypothetical protein
MKEGTPKDSRNSIIPASAATSPLLETLQAKGATLREMAAALANVGTTTRNGQPLSPSGVKNHLQRLGLLG